eukprot:4295538-Pyramimonas_sp.AAC.1
MGTRRWRRMMRNTILFSRTHFCKARGRHRRRVADEGAVHEVGDPAAPQQVPQCPPGERPRAA